MDLCKRQVIIKCVYLTVKQSNNVLMFEFLQKADTLGVQGFIGTLESCAWYLKSNTFNILISLVSRDCDLAKFFLLIHLTATSKLCFYKVLEEKEKKLEEAVRSV